MKRTQRNVFLAGLLMLSLSACSSWGGWKNPFSSGTPISTPAPAPSSTETAPSTGSSEKPATNGTAPTGQQP